MFIIYRRRLYNGAGAYIRIKVLLSGYAFQISDILLTLRSNINKEKFLKQIINNISNTKVLNDWLYF